MFNSQCRGEYGYIWIKIILQFWSHYVMENPFGMVIH